WSAAARWRPISPSSPASRSCAWRSTGSLPAPCAGTQPRSTATASRSRPASMRAHWAGANCFRHGRAWWISTSTRRSSQYSRPMASACPASRAGGSACATCAVHSWPRRAGRGWCTCPPPSATTCCCSPGSRRRSWHACRNWHRQLPRANLIRMRGQAQVLVNTPEIELWPGGLLRARSNHDARTLARARHVLRRKRDGRYLAADLPEGLLPLVPRLPREPGLNDALHVLARHHPSIHARPGIDIVPTLPLLRLQARLDALGLDADSYADRTGLPQVAEPAWLS